MVIYRMKWTSLTASTTAARAHCPVQYRHSTVEEWPRTDCRGGPNNQCQAEIWHPTNRTPGKQCDRQTDRQTIIDYRTVRVYTALMVDMRLISRRARSTDSREIFPLTRVLRWRLIYLRFAPMNSVHFFLCICPFVSHSAGSKFYSWLAADFITPDLLSEMYVLFVHQT